MRKSEYISQNQLAQIIIKALNDIKRKGYRLELRREATCIFCIEWQQWIMPANFTVDESFYFEEIPGSDEDRMLYAISLSQGAKGFLIDTCGVYADNISPEMMQKLNTVSKHSVVVVDAIMFTKPLEIINQASY